MGEGALQWMQILKLFAIAASAGLYGFGGMGSKWLRRFISPLVITGSILALSAWAGTFSWWFALYAPLLMICYSLGYGTNSWLMQQLKSKELVRGAVGLLIALSALPMAVAAGSWLMFLGHLVLVPALWVLLGAWNPTKSARAEETTLGTGNVLLSTMGMI